MDKQIIIDGVDVNALYSDQIACMNRYEVANLFIKTVEQLKAKEQECEELKKTVNEAQNSGLDLKSFLVCEAVQNEYEQQLDQLKAELQKYKDMEAKGLEEFKNVGGCWGCGIQSSLDEVTKEFLQYKKSKQASYEQLQKKCNELELGIRKLQKQFGIEILYCKATGESTFRSTEILKLKQTLTEIKEIAESDEYIGFWDEQISQILQKISEVLDEEV